MNRLSQEEETRKKANVKIQENKKKEKGRGGE
jgi:hypothetical protein